MAQCVQACMWGPGQASTPESVPGNVLASSNLGCDCTTQTSLNFPLMSQKWPSKRQLDTRVWWEVDTRHQSFPMHWD